ncbi:hypothetical protein AB0K15_45295 [Amycolatopsis sp. NPDC049253]|uniref:hypothetical protein n=1 Tax=Amycolatopsis sp. NPDC049253 TaxID=3155274 RepID=UPI003421CAE7
MAVLLEPPDRVAEPRDDDLPLVERVAVQALGEQRVPDRALAQVALEVGPEDLVRPELRQRRPVLRGQLTFPAGQRHRVHAIAQQVHPRDLPPAPPAEQPARPCPGVAGRVDPAEPDQRRGFGFAVAPAPGRIGALRRGRGVGGRRGAAGHAVRGLVPAALQTPLYRVLGGYFA